jgi:citronellol/citronellal dehydrogenase
VNRFRGKKIVVTGASRGIGAAIAERLAAEGADLAVVARTFDRHDHLEGSLTETVARCEPYGVEVEPIVADLSDERSRAKIIPTAMDLFGGRIDVLINNAAAAIFQDICNFSVKRMRILFEVNVHAPAELSQAVIPGMLERGEGWIINVSSAGAAYTSGPQRPNVRLAPGAPLPSDVGIYCATKAALNRMTVAYAQALADKGIRVNTIAPRGEVLTEGTLAFYDPDSFDDGIIESMEAMVESVVALCDCPEESTGGVHYSVDLLQELGATVMTLDGTAPYPGGFRVFREAPR